MINSLASTVNAISTSGSRKAVSLADLEQRIGSKHLFQRMNRSADATAPVTRPAQTKRTLETPVYKDGNADRYQWENIRIVKPITATMRMVTAAEKDEPINFSVVLQALNHGTWHNLVTYEFRGNRGRRRVFFSDGKVSILVLDLPRKVVLEMANEDLNRNWTSYYEQFCNPMLRQVAV